MKTAERYPEILHELGERLATFKKSAEFTAEEIHLSTFVKGICERAKAAVDRRELCLIQTLAEDAVIRSDWNVLDKVCTGLLKNAIENTPDEGTIEVTVEKRAEETRISFTDHGVGITAANQRMIFGGFFHTQPTDLYSSKKPYEFNAGGTGADLLRIKSFSERLGFKVEFTSRRCPSLPRDRDFCPGKISDCRHVASKAECLANGGSTFVVRFPASPDSATAEASCSIVICNSPRRRRERRSIFSHRPTQTDTELDRIYRIDMKFLASPDERPQGVTFLELVNSQHALKFLKMVELFSIPSRSQTLDRTVLSLEPTGSRWKNHSYNL